MDNIIISLGGSLIVPDNVNVSYVKKFVKLIKKYTRKYRFFIVCGGGRTTRNYINALGNNVTTRQQDLLGIKITQVHALLVQELFGSVAHPDIILDPTKKVRTKKKVILAGGWKPGASSDFVATKLAETYKAKNVINLTNIDYVYDRDPKKYKNAKILKEVSWKDFQKIVGTKWKSGLNMPFDPIATKLAKKLKLKVSIVNGNKLQQFEAILKKKLFKGTLIR